MFKFVLNMILWNTKLSGVRSVRLDLGREPYWSGSESDMYTVNADLSVLATLHSLYTVHCT